MCTITLSYDENNAIAKSKLAALLATGLFTEQQTGEHVEDEKQNYRQEMDAFLSQSKRSMSHFMQRYL